MTSTKIQRLSAKRTAALGELIGHELALAYHFGNDGGHRWFVTADHRHGVEDHRGNFTFDPEPAHIAGFCDQRWPQVNAGRDWSWLDEILRGIDKTDDEPDGWWPTSTGVAFGVEVSRRIKAAIDARWPE